MDLHDTQGQRLYLTAAERAAATQAPLPVRTFCLIRSALHGAQRMILVP